MRRFPCNCEACDKAIRSEWDPKKSFEEQPRFQSVAGCEFAAVLGGEFDLNKWCVKKINKTEKTVVEEEQDEHKSDVIRNIAANVCQETEDGNC